jgi:carbon monoxide dehydrogenase subunit G
LPRFQLSVVIPRPAAEIFPWLLEADKVKQWTSGVEKYEPQGPIDRGVRIQQILMVSGQRLTLDVEVVRHDPPTDAKTSFDAQGIEVLNAYRLVEAKGTTRLTQTVDANAGGLKARFLLPILQPHLEKKLEADLQKLRETLAVS